MWEEILKLYEKLDAVGVVAPVAHTVMQADIGALLDAAGNLLGAKGLDHENSFIPCTEKSEYRTSGTAPHLIHDNLSYICHMEGYEKRHKLYIEQLRSYIDAVDDKLAKAVYKNTEVGTLFMDLQPIIETIDKPAYKINVIFAVYGEENISTVNRSWEKYYVSTLPINGFCGITGEKCHVPESYPGKIRNQGDFAKLFQRMGKDSIESMPEVVPGYVTAQKIIHTLQTFVQWEEPDHEMTTKEMRALLGMSRPVFSRDYGIPLRTLEDWESGKRKCPSYVTHLLMRCVTEDFKEKIYKEKGVKL